MPLLAFRLIAKADLRGRLVRDLFGSLPELERQPGHSAPLACRGPDQKLGFEPQGCFACCRLFVLRLELGLSFTTLSSTGLSDIVPVTGHARSVIMLEQLAGIFYIAMVVTRLVALRAYRKGPAA